MMKQWMRSGKGIWEVGKEKGRLTFVRNIENILEQNK